MGPGVRRFTQSSFASRPGGAKRSAPEDLFLRGAIWNEEVTFGRARICPYVLILDGWDEISVSVTEGFRVPAGQAYVPVESPRGELGAHVVSDGGTRPFRAHFRDPSFTNLQATSVMSEGGMVSDIIVAIASIDPVMGGVDR